jgi:hypothetical protein
MKKTYQPLVIKRADETIELLTSVNFFLDHGIESTKYIRTRLCDMITEKFINGELTEDEPMFDKDEFKKLLNEIEVHNVLEGLRKKGLIGSYEDDDVEETFFITDLGKKQMVYLGDHKNGN